MIFNFFKKKANNTSSSTPSYEQAILIYLDGTGLSDDVYKNYDLMTLEDNINKVIQPAGLGIYDGDESGGEGTTVYLYSHDAEKLLSAIKPILQSYPLCNRARVVIQKDQSGSNDREEVIVQK